MKNQQPQLTILNCQSFYSKGRIQAIAIDCTDMWLIYLLILERGERENRGAGKEQEA